IGDLLYLTMAKRGVVQGTRAPAEFAARMLPLLGDGTEALLASLDTPPPVSIRLNPTKIFHLEAERIPWCANGRYLAERPSFTLDPLLHAGAYYVQEASSMLLEQVIHASGIALGDILALDLCAAPGGKSTHLLSLLSEGSLLVANEIVPTRRAILAENVWKHGAGNCVITGSDPSNLERLDIRFDLIVLDAPCSGEGMFRKDPFAREQWSPALVEQCSATQRHIVQHAWNALAPGGVLVYSTCTWETEENEAQLVAFLTDGAEPVHLELDPAWGVQRTEVSGVVGHRCYPHRVRGEGFFVGALRKKGARSTRDMGAGDPRASDALPWLRKDLGLTTLEHREVMHALPSRWKNTIEQLGDALRVHSPGTPFAEMKGDAWIPHPAAALSRWLDRSTFPTLALNTSDALRYLRGEALVAQKAQGPALVTYAGHGLGWLNGAGNRWNNRWPAPWRIRSERTSAPLVPWAGSVGG
ncbi:MAG TPA: hypothetical protein PK760_07385, partial [Flavobacteriales bacterium]|nr:hypothetical protein [Flavobacteriales bacterium]